MTTSNTSGPASSLSRKHESSQHHPPQLCWLCRKPTLKQEEEEEAVQPSVSTQEQDDPHAEPAEMTALKLELSTLSTSHASLQNTVVLLQTQLVDLKRVNNQLQEENESYNILLREKTLSGQYDLFRQVNGGSPGSSDEDGQMDDLGDVRSVQSDAHSTQLGTVDEHPDEDHLHTDLGTDHGDDLMLNSDDEGSLAREGSTRGKRSRHGRNRHGSHSPPPRGESLAGLPITGPGLDLAAELGRAENKDILEGHPVDVSGPPKDKRGKKGVSESRKGFLRQILEWSGPILIMKWTHCETRLNLSKMQTRHFLYTHPRSSTGLSPRKDLSTSWRLIMNQSLQPPPPRRWHLRTFPPGLTQNRNDETQ